MKVRSKMKAVTVFTAILLCALMAIPMTAGATVTEKDNFVSIDYSVGNIIDSAVSDKGTSYETIVNAEDYGKSAVTFVQDETLGKTVADFNGSAAVRYGFNMAYLQEELLEENFTFETYVKLDANLPDEGIFNILGNFGGGSGTGIFVINGQLDFYSRVGDSYLNFAGISVSKGEWVHIVGTFDADNGVKKLYINGEEKGSIEFDGNITHFAGYLETTKDFMVGCNSNTGGSNTFNAEFDNPTTMRMAYLNIYNRAISATEVTELKSAVGGNQGGSSSPSTNPSTSPSTNPSGNDNPKTFDLGIVSLAAVALSSVVAIKKRK